MGILKVIQRLLHKIKKSKNIVNSGFTIKIINNDNLVCFMPCNERKLDCYWKAAKNPN